MPDTKKPRSRSWDRTDAAQSYRRQFRDEHYDRVEILLPAGTKSDLDARAKASGVSRNQWILQAIDAYRNT